MLKVCKNCAHFIEFTNINNLYKYSYAFGDTFGLCWIKESICSWNMVTAHNSCRNWEFGGYMYVGEKA